MTYGIGSEFDDRLLQLLEENGEKYGVDDVAFLMKVQIGLWQAIYHSCDKLPRDAKGTPDFELYNKIPELTEAVNNINLENMLEGTDNGPLETASSLQLNFYFDFIQEESKKLGKKYGYSIEEVANKLDVSFWDIHQMIMSKEIKAIKIGGFDFIAESEINRLLTEEVNKVKQIKEINKYLKKINQLEQKVKEYEDLYESISNSIKTT